MIHSPRPWALALALALVGAGLLPQTGEAQASQAFRAHLALVPVDAGGARRTSGVGEVVATLQGRTLEIAGSYRRLASAATSAQLHLAPPAFRGPAVHDLAVTGGVEGRIEGRIELDDAQAQALQAGHLYVQVYTETNPEGAIRGWLFAREDAQ